MSLTTSVHTNVYPDNSYIRFTLSINHSVGEGVCHITGQLRRYVGIQAISVPDQRAIRGCCCAHDAQDVAISIRVICREVHAPQSSVVRCGVSICCGLWLLVINPWCGRWVRVGEGGNQLVPSHIAIQ